MATTTPTSTSTIFRTCPLCEATCGLAITHDGERVLKITGDAEDVFSKGFICPKGAVLGQLDADPDRLKTPLIRRGGNWEAVDWETALDEVAAKIHAVQAEHGQNAVAVYLGNPSAHTLSGTLYNRALIKALATRQIYSASTVDQMPKHLASGLMFGSPFSIAVPDVDRTDFMLMLGANPWVSNGSLATAPDWPGRLRALRRRGGRLVVVDPLRTQTADHADE
ncbi:MAG: molybdopterin-dependent oxidoreductase, partial [Myxococcota bacterium]